MTLRPLPIRDYVNGWWGRREEPTREHSQEGPTTPKGVAR